MRITSDEDVLGGEPSISGTRIGVRHVVDMVIDGDRSPAYVADQLDLDLADVYAALSYYYDNVEEIRAAKRANEDVRERVREETIKPKEFAQ